MAGWIKLHRQLLNSNTFGNEKLLKVWIWCLLKATHTEYVQQVGRQAILLKPGEFIFGRKVAASELGMKESTVRDYVNLLKQFGNICIKSTNRYSIVTITQWEFYQSSDDKSVSKSDNKSTTDQQQINTNKNVKKDKNKYIREVYDLLQYWNEQNIVVHQETDNTLKQIQKGLNKLPFDEIKKAIDRYVTIYRDPDYFYKHKWTLPKFLNQSNGAPDFLNEGIRWVNYQQQAQQKTAKESPRRHRELYLPEESK